jgi:hypothetical protein
MSAESDPMKSLSFFNLPESANARPVDSRAAREAKGEKQPLMVEKQGNVRLRLEKEVESGHPFAARS